MEGLGQSPFPRELMIAYVSSLSRAHMPGAGNTLPLYPTYLPSLTQTRRELVYYQTFSWLQGWVHQFCPMGTAKFSWEQWRETRWDLGELWAPMWQLWSTHWCFMICLEILNSLYPPYAAPTKPIYIVSSDYTFSLGSWHVDSSYLSYFDPNATCPLPLRLSSMSHLKFTVFTTYPRYFPPLDSSKNAHIFSFMHFIHPIKY